MFETYKKLYSLTELVNQENVNFDFFRLCQSDYKFIVICIYNDKKEFLLTRDINKNVGWELVGGYIKEDERIEEAANRIVLRETGLMVNELQPITAVKNIFKCNNQTVTHYGFAFIALIKGRIKLQPKNIKSIYVREIPEKMAYQNKRILKKGREIILNRRFEPPYHEIENIRKFFLFYAFHKYIVKTIGKLSSKKIARQIMRLIVVNPRTILDSSCGDDQLIFELDKKYNPNLCVANDISWKTICLLKKKTKNSSIIFTNHNVLDIPFKQKFDLLIFKNTLHHIKSSDQVDLIKKLSRLSKQLIIVDVEDPNKSNFLSKIWHWYYVRLLGDQGESFLTFGKFKEIIKNNISCKKINFGIINTIKGKYFYASLSEEIEGEEIEIKASIDFSQINRIKEKLVALGAYFEGMIEETDIYFTAPHRDFITTKECLRIRKRDDNVELTYKGPTTRDMQDRKQFWKKEINIPLLSSVEDARKLFESIGFKEVAEVVKKREKFTLGRQKITIDIVEKAGCFIEIEIVAIDKDEREKALNDNLNLLKELDISENNIVTEPYRDIVRANKY